MMDTSLKGPIVEKKGRKNVSEENNSESFDDDKVNDCERYENPKNSSCEGFINLKQRRKQLKPIKIATNLEDMVKVPKQIIGLNNDLDNINDMSNIVPKETSSKTHEVDDGGGSGGDEDDDDKVKNLTVNDVHYPKDANDIKSHDSNSSADNCIDVTELNVPKLESGPNILADPTFLFPFRFHPFKTNPFWLPGDPKIFNYEAYCLLCKKEFCNKYFLKTHKANKHGIVDDGSSTVAMKQIAEYIKAMSKTSENGVSQTEGECKQPFCDLCNRKYSGKYLSRRRRAKCHRRVDGDGFYGGNSFDEPKIVQSSSQTSTNETGSTLYEPLALIQNDMDDNQKEDEKSIEQETPLNLIVASKDSVNGDDEEENETSQMGKSEESDQETEKNIDMEMDTYESDGMERETADSDEGSSENIEKLQTMLLKLTPSESETKICGVCNEVMDGNHDQKCVPVKQEREQHFTEAMNESSNESKQDMPMLKKENRSYIFMNRMENVKKIKPTSSYCEICNKELCNKYFMRTHMQRMHGIEIEHGTQLGGVTCNVCNKELCSKYFLRVHKQNTHGIMNPNSMVGPSTSGTGSNHRIEMKSIRSDHRFPSNFTQVCYICNKRFRSPKWLQAHFLNEHRDEVAKTAKDPGTSSATATVVMTAEEESKGEDTPPTLKIPKKSPNLPPEQDTPETLNVISKLFWENNSLSKSYTCSQCPFSTSVLAFLFVHERSHFVQTTQDQSEIVKPSVSLQNLIHDKTFWQHKITQQISDCLDLSESGKAKQVSIEQNGS